MRKNSKEESEMPVPRDSTILKPDSRKVLIAMVAAEMKLKDIASESIRTIMQE